MSTHETPESYSLSHILDKPNCNIFNAWDTFFLTVWGGEALTVLDLVFKRANEGHGRKKSENVEESVPLHNLTTDFS